MISGAPGNHTMDYDHLLASYQRDGFAILPELFTPTECAALKAEARTLLDQPQPPAGVGRSASVYVGAAVASARFRELASDQRLLAPLWSLIPEGPMFLSDKLVFKSARQRFASPWHADMAYWRGTRPKISLWLALDDATADNGALMVVPGSHRDTWEHSHGRGVGGNGEFVHTVTPDWPRTSEVVCALHQGGAILFSDRLLHASTENRAGTDRYSLISTYHAFAPDEPFDRGFPARHPLPQAPRSLQGAPA